MKSIQSSINLGLVAELYDEIQVSLITNDKNYIVQNINGTLFFDGNYKECLKKKN